MIKYENIEKTPKKFLAKPSPLPYIRFDVAVSAYASGKRGIRFLGRRAILEETGGLMATDEGMQAFAGKKIAAGICGILLGSLGIHKFILGLTTPAVIMLVVTLVGGIVTCGTASGVMHIIGIIEGILYLTKSDEEFYRLYAVEKKGWF
ncbi:MAG TPA: TM2 domain-containing protein [Gemmataceae bacterium]